MSSVENQVVLPLKGDAYKRYQAVLKNAIALHLNNPHLRNLLFQRLPHPNNNWSPRSIFLVLGIVSNSDKRVLLCLFKYKYSCGYTGFSSRTRTAMTGRSLTNPHKSTHTPLRRLAWLGHQGHVILSLEHTRGFRRKSSAPKQNTRPRAPWRRHYEKVRGRSPTPAQNESSCSAPLCRFPLPAAPDGISLRSKICSSM